MNVLLLALIFGIGVVAGLRSMTAPAVLSWSAHWGWVSLAGSRLAGMATLRAAIFLTLFAVAELVADKLPFTPNRTAPGPLVARIVTGSLCGAALAASTRQSLAWGVALGAAGAIAGAYGGYHARRALVKDKHLPAFAVALGEDALAVGSAFAIVLLLGGDWVQNLFR